jgi:hypothetical protein
MFSPNVLNIRKIVRNGKGLSNPLRTSTHPFGVNVFYGKAGSNGPLITQINADYGARVLRAARTCGKGINRKVEKESAQITNYAPLQSA